MPENDHALALAEGDERIVLRQGGVRIGDAIAAAMREYERTPRPKDLLHLCGLLGDPAMALGR